MANHNKYNEFDNFESMGFDDYNALIALKKRREIALGRDTESDLDDEDQDALERIVDEDLDEYFDEGLDDEIREDLIDDGLIEDPNQPTEDE